MVRRVDSIEEGVKARIGVWWIDRGAGGMKMRIDGGEDAWVSHARVP